MTAVPEALVSRVRSSSRQLVRELGFMGQTLAGTDLHASAVHAIIEIGTADGLTAKQLANKLLLEKSTISRLLKGLKTRGEIAETKSDADARAKHLALTPQGERTLEAVAAFAAPRVSNALSRLGDGQRAQVSDALEAYANALAQCRAGASAENKPTDVSIATGYAPGVIGAIAGLHGAYYARETGFDAAFEATVAKGLAEFAPRLCNPVNQIWHARRDGAFVGSIAIDGEDLGEGIGHLRWFIVSDALRGTGVGRTLLGDTLRFCDRQGFRETHLWTFKGLDAARRLYEANGFVLADEYWGDQWGKKVREQRFVRPLGAEQ